MTPDLESAITAMNLLDHQHVDWKHIQRTVYLIHQHLHYRYPGPIADLRQRLMVVPPETHGDQRRLDYRLDISHSTYELVHQNDPFGNQELQLYVPSVEQQIDFEAWILVERQLTIPHYIEGKWLTDTSLLEPSELTQPDENLRQVVSVLQAGGKQGLELAEEINTWVYQLMTYRADVTTIRTTAAEALVAKQGVCQDYAHLMIALCRICAIPARYVSGHLLGEGGTHAWVEVLLPVEQRPEVALVVPFDPTHGRRINLSYLTIAVGRDYFDVAPTSGTFRAAYRGELTTNKMVGLMLYE